MRGFRFAVLAAAALAAACAPERGPRLPAGTPVVLISIDTLRADRLPAYGYDGVATPAIDALRRDGVLFERAWSHVPLTLPSHASILTGQLPGTHGARDNLGYPVPADAPLLQETLRGAGYATGGAVASYVLRGATGIERGFDVFDDDIPIPRMRAIGLLQRSGAETVRRALEWLATVGDRPYFLFVHLYEPHSPYTPPEPFRSRYRDPYDGEVAAADAAVGTILDALRARGDYDRALVVLLSDHGEGLGDHDEDEHGVFLYRTTLQVPLIVKLPGSERAGTTDADPAALVDVHPTVLDLLGLAPGPAVEGVPLFRPGARPRERPIYGETLYPRLHFGWSELTSLVAGPHHYVHGPAPELFDLDQDPDERRNLAGPGGTVQGDLAARLAEYAAPIERPRPSDPEALRNLASLGYVGAVPLADDGDGLPDPRERREELRRIREAFRLNADGRHEEAVAALRRVLDDNPDLVDGWESYARSLEALGRLDDAIAAYREAIRRSGGSPVLAIPAAALLQRAGLSDEARALAELGRAADPAAADTVLAQIALHERRYDDAERHVRAALERRPRGIVQKLVLAEILVSRGRDDEAMRFVREAEQAYAGGFDPDPAAIRGLHLLRGRILANAGEGPAAEAEFLREIALFPDQTGAYSHLAILYRIVAGPREAEVALDRMVARNPDPAAYAAAIRTARTLGMDAAARRYLEAAARRFPDHPQIAEAARS